ncbi:hypothetical protein DAEQUDRAFT_758660 [Daedalea quercina L-15889]|uniref:DUF6534 domain-containing protein n=1 Tax=Daedalea quercina L-15889 TaxID=1314783 RepID=A0A165N5B9_9APHY|nr:hypothetical protein DAEQUDRAFT_758660 [Daedalea quercina L-15889]
MTDLESELNSSLGCMFLSGLFSFMLYGCTCGQGLYYIGNYASSDHKHIKGLTGWDILARIHGDIFAFLGTLPRILPAEFFLSCITIFIVQCCYLYTIWTFLERSDHHWRWLLCIILPPSLLALGSLVSGLVSSIQLLPAKDIEVALEKTKIVGAIRPGCSVIVDIYITVWLCYHLQDAKTGHERSDNMMTKLINYAITRGIVTSVVQTLAFALFLVDAKGKTLWSMIFYVPASTLYVNSLLAMWNARRHVAKIGIPSVPSAWSNNMAIGTVQMRQL